MTIQLSYGVLKLSTLFSLLPLEYPNVVYSAVQAGLNVMESRYPKLYFLMQKVKGVFIAIDFVALFWTVGKLVMALDTKFQLLQGTGSSLVVLGAYGCALAWIVVGIGAVYAINQYINWRRDVKKTLEVAMGDEKTQPENIKIDINFEKTLGQEFEQWMYVTRIVVNVALACLVPGGIFFAVSAAFQTCSLISVSQWKWLRFNVQFKAPEEVADQFRSITFQYYTLLFPASKRQKDDCVVCIEPEPDIQYCSEHILHEACVLQWIYTKSKDYLNQFISHRSEKKRGVASYHITLLKDIKPTCPTCRGEPLVSDLKAHVDDKRCSRSSTNLNFVSQEDMKQLRLAL